MACATPTRRGFKRSLSRSQVMCNSSDTEESWTPPQKRFRFAEEDEETCGSPGSSTSYANAAPPTSSPTSCAASPSKRRRKAPASPNFDLTSVLRRCSSPAMPIDAAMIKDVKTFPRGESDGIMSVKELLRRVKLSVKTRFDQAGDKLLETELYLEWLLELDFAVTAIENLLSAKAPGTRKRITGLGRLSFTILYQLIDEFISEVDSHHDGWSYRSPSFSARAALYPSTMTIVEESHESTADVRTDLAGQEAEELLVRYDAVMADAVRRYKIECGRHNVNLADVVGGKECALARACCLLCEQTGYGSNENDTGDTLLLETRTAMQEWKREYGSNAPEDVGDDELTSD